MKGRPGADVRSIAAQRNKRKEWRQSPITLEERRLVLCLLHCAAANISSLSFFSSQLQCQAGSRPNPALRLNLTGFFGDCNYHNTDSCSSLCDLVWDRRDKWLAATARHGPGWPKSWAWLNFTRLKSRRITKERGFSLEMLHFCCCTGFCLNQPNAGVVVRDEVFATVQCKRKENKSPLLQGDGVLPSSLSLVPLGSDRSYISSGSTHVLSLGRDRRKRKDIKQAAVKTVHIHARSSV